MPTDRLDFDKMGENDLKELLTTQVPEGLRIEYKREPYGNSDAETREALREALKDISWFANASGGHLVIGIEEQNGLPIAIPGISNMNADDVLQHLEQLMLSGIGSVSIELIPVPLRRESPWICEGPSTN